jgi:hypothetical protein
MRFGTPTFFAGLMAATCAYAQTASAPETAPAAAQRFERCAKEVLGEGWKPPFENNQPIAYFRNDMIYTLVFDREIPDADKKSTTNIFIRYDSPDMQGLTSPLTKNLYFYVSRLKITPNQPGSVELGERATFKSLDPSPEEISTQMQAPPLRPFGKLIHAFVKCTRPLKLFTRILEAPPAPVN